ncbi:hypothetical protein ES703_121202 [subsurface metagenome]
MSGIGALPSFNARDAYFPNWKRISADAVSKQVLIKKTACYGCPIACVRLSEIREGKYKGDHGEGPEYETIWSLGAMCGADDLNAITEAHYLCNEYGFDAMSAGVTISCAMELYEMGYMPKEDAPFPIKFGDADAVVELVKLMGNREGIGDLLAEGSYRLAERYGHPELSMSVKKQEIGGYDPRAIKGIGLGYATSNRGACHMKAYTISQEVFGIPYKAARLAYEGKAELTKFSQDFTAVVDSSGICAFTTFGIWTPEYVELIKEATGIPYEEEELLRAGERIWNLERLFNLKAGFTKKDDTLPERFFKEPIKSGASKGEVFELDKMLSEYYKLRGWDSAGIPTKAKLKELGLQ